MDVVVRGREKVRGLKPEEVLIGVDICCIVRRQPLRITKQDMPVNFFL